ncbi:MAG: amino acid ABC transporter permease [Coriobacteriales bacterium]|nr:amino acid ABC transporter permease [Coriobacteriales bacterium]
MKKSDRAQRATAANERLTLRDILPKAFSLMLAFALMAPCLAGAITVDNTTARPTQTTVGNSVYAGDPTRVTWECVVGENEEVSSIFLQYPEGTVFSNESYARLTALDGLDRLEVDAVDPIMADGTVRIEFKTPLAPGTRLRVEMYFVALPAPAGGVVITGSYTTRSGAVQDLPASPAIEVVGKSSADAMVAWLDEQPWVEKWNSVPFLRTFFKPQLIVASFPSLFKGWLRAMALVLIGFPLAIPLGLVLALLKIGKFKLTKGLASLYVNVVRGTPLFLQIYIAFFGLPLMGITANNYVVGVIVLAMNSSAYLCEIFRAGIQSIHKGQFEAAASLGMNGAQTMFNVIIPQTVRRVIPTMTSEFILLYKDTSLLSAVGVMELMMFGKSLVANTGNITPYIVAACYYLLVTLPLIKLVNVLEARLSGTDGGSGGKTKAKKARKSGKKLLSAISPVPLPGDANVAEEAAQAAAEPDVIAPATWTPDAEPDLSLTAAGHEMS